MLAIIIDYLAEITWRRTSALLIIHTLVFSILVSSEKIKSLNVTTQHLIYGNARQG